MKYSPSSAWHRVRIVGKGSYGIVYLAHHMHTNNTIALKRARLKNSSSLIKENRILEYFRNCAEIVHCYGSEITAEEDGEFYHLLLEYAPAGTLLDLILSSSSGCITYEIDVRTYTKMILKGISRINAKGIVHCDIKPDNILVFPSECEGIYQLKISDFGVAKEPGEESSESEKPRGTPAYMSPEFMVRGKIEPAMDIWSLGCVVVAMITGSDAWQGAETGTIVHMMDIREKTPKIPENMSEIGKDFLRKCFERDPRKRWSARMLLRHPYVSDGSQVDEKLVDEHE